MNFSRAHAFHAAGRNKTEVARIKEQKNVLSMAERRKKNVRVNGEAELRALNCFHSSLYLFHETLFLRYCSYSLSPVFIRFACRSVMSFRTIFGVDKLHLRVKTTGFAPFKFHVSMES